MEQEILIKDLDDYIKDLDDYIKDLDDYEDIKPFLPFTEIFESGYFFSEKGIDNEIRVIEKEDYLEMISRLAVDEKDEDYIFFYQVFDPEIKYYLVAQTKYYLVAAFERFDLNETEYFKNDLAYYSKYYPNVYLLILDYKIEVYKENRLTKQIKAIKKLTFGRIYKVKYRQEVF